MNIQTQLKTDYQTFVNVANLLTDEQLAQQRNGKWSVAEVMQHLYLSARPVVRLMSGPRAVFDQWGTPDSPSKPYDEIAEAYRIALRSGRKALDNMSPRPEDTEQPRAVIDRFAAVYESLIEAIETWEEADFDRYQLPHPALGLITLREMVYFTSIHTQHHFILLELA